MEKQRSLESLLRDHNVSADQFFQQKGISAQIRNTNTMPRFIKFLKTHRNFTTRMLHLALNISSQELEDKSTAKAVNSIIELLANQETQIFELFFEIHSKEQSQTIQITQQPETGIRSQAQRLFRFDSDQQETSEPQQPRAIEIRGRQMIDLSFRILQNPSKNQTCLGHLQKLYSYFIRHDPMPVLAYFQQNPEIIKLLINNIGYSSVSSLMAQILTSQDKNNQYKYENFKKNILVEILESIFLKMQDPMYFEGALIFLEEILNASKQTYYEFFQDFKRVVQYLGSAHVLNRFYSKLLQLHQPSFSSASKFLQILFTRLNSQAQERNQNQVAVQKPEIKFQVSIFIQSSSKLLELVSEIQHFNSLTKISFLSFLQALLNSSHFKNVKLNLNDPFFATLLETYTKQNKGGIFKIKLYKLINKVISLSQNQSLKYYIQLHPHIYEEYFKVLKTANYNNTKLYNKNQLAAFDISLVAQLTMKSQEGLENASKILGKDMKRICKKYDTKLASFQNNSIFNLQQQFFSQFNESINKPQAESGTGFTGFSLNLVGKNNISIPFLQLPEKNKHMVEQPTEVKQFEEQLSTNQVNQPLEIIQFEEVESITNKLDRLQIKTTEKQESSGQTQTKVQEKQGSEKQDDVGQNVLEKASKKQAQQNVKKAVSNVTNQEKAKFYARHLTIFV